MGRGRIGTPGRPGFTLIEVLVVVSILAIVLALAAPRVGRVPSRVQAEYCVSAVRSALDIASLRARTTGQPSQLVLVPESQLEASADGSGSPWWGKALRRWHLVGGRRDEVEPEDLETGVFVMEPAEPDPLAQMLSGRSPTLGSASPAAETEVVDDVFGLARDQFPLPEAVVWDPDSVRAATGDGARGPTFVFRPSGEAAGPEVEFRVGRRHYRLAVDALTGRVDIYSLDRR